MITVVHLSEWVAALPRTLRAPEYEFTLTATHMRIAKGGRVWGVPLTQVACWEEEAPKPAAAPQPAGKRR